MINNIHDRTFALIYERLVRMFSSYWAPWEKTIPKQVPVSSWHSKPTDMPSIEIPFINYEVYVPATQSELARSTGANLPWAEDHFQERVSGVPHNPAPSEAWWPFAVQNNGAHKIDEVYSHTYPERYWPRYAGNHGENVGVRYPYGDFQDVVNLLLRDPLTRQAYLPVWFPEDTGAVHGERVPCSLGYHFLVRGGNLHCNYTMRSCDFIRHWSDDMYMTGRLMQRMADYIGVNIGSLICQISSLHIFEGDALTMSRLMGEIDEDYKPATF